MWQLREDLHLSVVIGFNIPCLNGWDWWWDSHGQMLMNRSFIVWLKESEKDIIS